MVDLPSFTIKDIKVKGSFPSNVKSLRYGQVALVGSDKVVTLESTSVLGNRGREHDMETICRYEIHQRKA